MDYDLEIEKVVSEIRKNDAKLVCIQLPDGLKPKAKEIQQKLKAETKAEIVIWLGTCFGSCDIPHALEKLNIDLLIQWGHSSNFPYFK